MKIYDISRRSRRGDAGLAGRHGLQLARDEQPGRGRAVGLDVLHDERPLRHARRCAEPRLRRRQDDRRRSRSTAYVGPARVVELPGLGEVGPGRPAAQGARRRARPLSQRRQGVAVAARGAAAWPRRGPMLVGTDAASIDPEDAEDLPAHRALLGNGRRAARGPGPRRRARRGLPARGAAAAVPRTSTPRPCARS